MSHSLTCDGLGCFGCGPRVPDGLPRWDVECHAGGLLRTVRVEAPSKSSAIVKAVLLLGDEGHDNVDVVDVEEVGR